MAQRPQLPVGVGGLLLTMSGGVCFLLTVFETCVSKFTVFQLVKQLGKQEANHKQVEYSRQDCFQFFCFVVEVDHVVVAIVLFIGLM